LTRLGLLGGTFDPPHYGHLVAAHEAAWQFDLNRVLFVPARQNPLKREEPVSDAEIRCQMVQLAIADNSLFELSRVELDRPPPSFTVDLLRGLAAPGCELFFLVGADIIPELPRWHAPLEILSLARLVVVTRAGSPAPDLAQLERILPGAAARISVLNIPGVDVSSTALRTRVREGNPIRYLTPDPVARFIADHGLYC
jgi:nicotinate-nucleotide adenylyltransferase